MDGTIPHALPDEVAIAAAALPDEDLFAAWAAETEAAISEAEIRCHKCQASDALTRFPFALAHIDLKFSWAHIAASVAASAFLVPAGMWVLWWKWKRRGLAFRMNLVLCPECSAELQNFYGLPPRESYQLHPCYAGLEEEGFVTFVSQAEFKNWAIIQPE